MLVDGWTFATDRDVLPFNVKTHHIAFKQGKFETKDELCANALMGLIKSQKNPFIRLIGEPLKGLKPIMEETNVDSGNNYDGDDKQSKSSSPGRPRKSV